MKNFLHLYRFGEWLGEQGFNVIHPIKQADASWMQMLGIASAHELKIQLEQFYHFQAPIKAYSPQDVIKKLKDGISAYGLRINSKLDVNSRRTADSEKTIVKPPSTIPWTPPPTIYYTINNFVCENCTYSRVRKHEKGKEEIIIEEKF